MRKHPRTRVTDHAIIRYLERVGGFDIEGLRHEIGRRVDPAVATGAEGVIIDGFSYRIGRDHDGTPVVVTVLVQGEDVVPLRSRALR